MTGAIRERLMLQGFACDTDPGVAGAAAWLRFNPSPRRFAMAVAAAWSALAGWLLASGPTWAGVVAGALLAGAGVTVATTHFCLGSWLYRLLRGQ